MIVADILLKCAGMHKGYMPQTVSRTTFDPAGIMPKLRTVPRKITAYFDRAKISEVYKSNYALDPLDNYYIIRATDGTLFHVDY